MLRGAESIADRVSSSVHLQFVRDPTREVLNPLLTVSRCLSTYREYVIHAERC